MCGKAVFGLGNPGDRYTHTRHNVGARAVLALVKRLKPISNAFEDGFCQAYRHNHHLLLLPQTYMNLSGMAVQEAVAHHALRVENCLIVYDDMDLPFGQLRLREAGSAGGQRGMRSVIEQLGTQRVPRMRIGIGRPQQEKPEAFVLDCFDADERAHLPDVLARAADAIACFLDEGLAVAMTRHNGSAL